MGQHRRLKWMVGLGSAVFLAALMVGVGVMLDTTHDHTRDQLAHRAGVISGALAGHIGRTVAETDTTLVTLADNLRTVWHEDEAYELLGRWAKWLPQVRAFIVLDADGILLHDSEQSPPPRINLSKRDYFLAHKDDGSDSLFIGEPVVGKMTGKWFVGTSRRITRVDGSFGGVVAAVLDPAYFNRFFEGLGIGEAGVLTVLHRNGTLVARAPHEGGWIGRSFAEGPVFAALESGEAGENRIVSQDTAEVGAFGHAGGSSLVAARALDDFPFVVAVGLSEAVAFREWRAMARTWAGAGLAIAGAMLFLLALLYRHLNRLERMELALRDSESRFRTMFDDAPLGIVMVSSKGVVLESNAAFARMMGYDRDGLIGLHFRQFTHPDDQESSKAALVALVSGETDHYHFEKRYIKRTGEIIEVALTIAMVRGTEPGSGFFISMIEEISERKRFQEDLQRSNADLQQFAYAASHDLQEPLRMVTSYLQLLERRYKDRLDEDAVEFIDFAVDGAKRMSGLITDLLQFSRVETHGSDLVAVDAKGPLERALRNLDVVIRESEAEITVGEMPLVLADTAQLERLFQNLLGNAVKYRHAERRPEVRVMAERIGGAWEFTVADNGIGIDPKYYEKVFMVFQRLHGRGEYEGTGIGLAVCKRIVERHGGRIGVLSTPGEGSVFHFSLRAVEEEEAVRN